MRRLLLYFMFIRSLCIYYVVLSGGFAESLVSDIDARNADYASQRASPAEYGYESDSDLEDDNDDDDDDGDVHPS